jgi:hypothetical protein
MKDDEKRIVYYYIRDIKKRPIITVCLIENFDGQWCRGISICSKHDNPVKKIGRVKAYGRARQAMVKKMNIKKLKNKNDFEYYSSYSILLNENEHKIVYKKVISKFYRQPWILW